DGLTYRINFSGVHSDGLNGEIFFFIYQESLEGHFLRQVGGGPALGIIQMEPATYDDIWNNYLAYKRSLANKLIELASMSSLDDDMRPNATQLITNLAFSVGMCRVHYLRKKPPLPSAGDIEGLAHYWKDHYNTSLGAGTVEEFIDKFPTEILDI
ncbi:hypothetical protein, partial [Vibrio vulnificus]|uniref:hypothetical protein n=1 Tax=Vibrio vulnificus TaxID=672 RepID=UPI003263D572